MFRGSTDQGLGLTALASPLDRCISHAGKGDYQKFMAQYAQDFQNYLQGQGKSANGNGDYQKYMSDFQQYMKGQGGSHGDYQKYMSMYAADFDKYQKQYTNGQGGSLPGVSYRQCRILHKFCSVWRHRHAERQTGTQADRHTSRQAGRHGET